MGNPILYVRGIVAYDGTDYHGFQYQAGVPTIQSALETALDRCTTAESRVAGAGRTDTGVHASGQVIAVRVRWRHGIERLQEAWNAYLPPSICVQDLAVAPEGFHPRFSAIWRTYRYYVCCHGEDDGSLKPRRSPLTDRFALFEPNILHVEHMNLASVALCGEHDFATFGQPTQGDSTIRFVRDAAWHVHAAAAHFPGCQLVFTITANGFLRQMVRRVTGALLEVGRGRLLPMALGSMLEAKDRSLAVAPAPSSGLVLERVTYPDEWEWLPANCGDR